MRYTQLVIAVALVVLLLGCIQPSQSFPLNQPFYVKEGVTYQAQDLSIKVISFTDSRCPKDVECIWAGERGVNLQVNDANVFLGEVTKTSVSILLKENVINLSLFSISPTQAQIKVTSTPLSQIVCTMEVKICPDGSAVGREAPFCEFDKCPGE